MVYISLSMQYIVIFQNMLTEIFSGFWIDVLTLLEKKKQLRLYPTILCPLPFVDASWQYFTLNVLKLSIQTIIALFLLDIYFTSAFSFFLPLHYIQLLPLPPGSIIHYLCGLW